MIRAFLAGILIAVIAPLSGTFLVARRYALIADSLAHVSLAGVAIGLLTGTYPILTALVIAILAAVLIEKLRSSRRVSGDTALAMFLSGGLALAVVLIGLARGFNVDLFSYLFGSITTVRPQDIWVILGLGIVVLATVVLLYKEFLFLSFDDEAAAVSGLPTRALNTIFVILTVVTVVLSMRIVGALLIGALMVIPVVTASQFARSFRQTILIAVVLSLLAVIGGLFVSYYFDLAAGGVIVLLALLLFGFTALVSRGHR